MNLRPLAVIGALVVLVEAVLLVTDTGPNVWLVAALVSVVGGASWSVITVNRFVARPAAAPLLPARSERIPPRIGAVRQALAVSASDPRHAQRLRTQLVAIVDDELRSTHNIDRRTDPEAAQAVLGDELDRFVTDSPSEAALTPRSLDHIVTLIEQL